MNVGSIHSEISALYARVDIGNVSTSTSVTQCSVSVVAGDEVTRFNKPDENVLFSVKRLQTEMQKNN